MKNQTAQRPSWKGKESTAVISKRLPKKGKESTAFVGVSPRELAYHLIYQVKYQGAYSNIRLNQLLRKHELSDRDRGFATELSYGTLEKVFYLDHVIAKYSSQPLQRLSPELLVLLEMGAYQLHFMHSVTDYAAAFETVGLAKKVFPQGSGFVNGILRSILRDPQAFCLEEKGSKDWSVCYGVSWDIVRSFRRDYGDSQSRLILEGMNDSLPLHLRVNTGKISRAELIARLQEEGVQAQEHEGSLRAMVVRGIKNMEDKRAFRDGLFSVQNICSMLAVEVLDPQEEETILDLCACPGGKTSYIAELLCGTGRVEAWDISSNKLPLVETACLRLGLTNVEVRCWDARQVDEQKAGQFHRVLADVPCSGLGVAGRRPEIRFKTTSQWKDLPAIQSKILENAGHYVKKGGVLVYSTCTLRKEENQAIVEGFLKKNPAFAPEEFESYFGRSNNGMLQIFPQQGADGFFMAKMRKKE